MKLFKLTSIFVFAMFSMVSCTKDLNITPNDDQSVLSEEFFENENAYRDLIAGVYANFALTGIDGPESSNIQGLDAGTSQYGRVLLYLQTLSADQMVWSYENDPGTREIQRNIWTAQNPLLIGMFGRASASVAFANNFLRESTEEKLNQRNISDEIRNEVVKYRAEARLLRALSYYHLMDLFGKAPMVTENDPLTNYTPPQAERAELFSFIESELLDIEADLANPLQNEHGRADKAAAWMILAKIYLNAEVYIGENKYTECITYCNKIASGGHMLATDYLHNFMADNDTNSARNEIIFPLVSDGVYTQNYGPTTVLINGQVGSLEENGENLGVGAPGWGGAIRVRRELANLFNGSAFNNDTRNTLITADRDAIITDIADKDQGYVLEKYSNKTSDGEIGSDQTFVDTDFPLFRLADVYLMYAEAVVRGGSGGSMAQAVDYVNMLRNRANNPEAIDETGLTLDFILDERARELHWEAHRRQDLIRFGKFVGGNYNWTWKGNASNGISIPNHFNVYPIPNPSRASNPNLTQNPGY
ncbi:RagB/SusD family nutrient uptake outer membrane protein [Tenacibaculum geojense]